MHSLTVEPVVSVHMPVYNAGRYLAEAVESVLTQTFTDFEFIIIDDGSTDRSLEILEGYAGQDERIRLSHRANRGITATRNEALGQARGEFFAVMDADDRSLPNRFERQVDWFRKTPDCVAVGCRVLYIDPEGAPICEASLDQSHEKIDAAHIAGRGGAIAHPAAMIRRSAIVAVGGYREQYETAEDLDLFLRLAEQGRLANLPDVLFHYRQHLSSASYARRQRVGQDTRAVIEEARARRGLERVADDVDERSIPRHAADHHRKWAWWALKAGNVGTARKHALAALRGAPFSIESWRAMACAVRGR